MDEVASRLSSLALTENNIVVIIGLESAPQYNYRAARVLSAQTSDRGRLGVELLHGEAPKKRLSVRRCNLLRASHPEDRAALMTRLVLDRQLELRVCRNFLLEHLQGEEGLLLHIASFFPPRETMALTTGFAMGRIVPSWVCATLRGGRALGWHPIHDGRAGWDGANVPVEGEKPVTDGIVRIDCAVVSIGSGQFVVAGGCSDHPSRARKFFASAFLYDALTHVATPLPDMPHPRHGCKGAYLDGKVYVVGGDYCTNSPEKCLCCVLDLQTRTWSNLQANAPSALSSQHVAFCPVGAIDGRVVFFHACLIFAYNPFFPDHGWVCLNSRIKHSTPQPLLGRNACEGVEWGRHFVISSGRGGSEKCEVMAFSFLNGPRPSYDLQDVDPNVWARGVWADLGPTGPTGRVGCGLAVVQNRLYVSGGVDEGDDSGHAFDGSVAKWSGTLEDLPKTEGEDAARDAIEQVVTNCRRPWHKVEELHLPTAMHAHSAITIPWLPSSA